MTSMSTTIRRHSLSSTASITVPLWITTTSVPTDVYDVFQALRSDLDKDGHDLEWSMSNRTMKEIEHLPEPRQLRRDCLIMSGRMNKNNVESLLDKRPLCLHSCSGILKLTFFRELTHYAGPFHPLRLEELTMLSYKMSVTSLHKELWITYLQSGIGKLENSHPSRGQDERTE